MNAHYQPVNDGYQIIGSPGNRLFIATWANCPHWLSGGYTTPTGVTCQAILSEYGNTIQFNYQNVFFANTKYDRGFSATVGLQDPTGTRGYLYSFNEAALSNYSSLLFVPPTSASSSWALYQ